MDVASIRSFYLREASRDLPTPVERATAAAVEGRGVVAQASLAASNAFETQLIFNRLSTDTSAFANPARANAAYDYSVALVNDAFERQGDAVDVTA